MTSCVSVLHKHLSSRICVVASQRRRNPSRSTSGNSLRSNNVALSNGTNSTARSSYSRRRKHRSSQSWQSWPRWLTGVPRTRRTRRPFHRSSRIRIVWIQMTWSPSHRSSRIRTVWTQMTWRCCRIRRRRCRMPVLKNPRCFRACGVHTGGTSASTSLTPKRCVLLASERVRIGR